MRRHRCSEDTTTLRAEAGLQNKAAEEEERRINVSSSSRVKRLQRASTEDTQKQSEKSSPARQPENKLKLSLSSTNRRRIDFSPSLP